MTTIEVPRGRLKSYCSGQLTALLLLLLALIAEHSLRKAGWSARSHILACMRK